MRCHLLAILVSLLLMLGGCSSRPYKPVEGLDVDTVRQKMETDLHMVFDQPGPVKSWNLATGKVKLGEGVELVCDIAYYDDGKVWSVGYTVDWTQKAMDSQFQLDPRPFHDIAKRFLPYCAASVRYGDVDPVAAKAFVEQALSHTSPFGGEEYTAGNTRFTVFSFPDKGFDGFDVENAATGK